MSDLNEEVLNTINIIEKKGDEFFLDLVKQRPAIYDKQISEHQDSVVVENCFEGLAFLMNETGL